MNNYVPFLKVKANEIGAVCTLEKDIQNVLTPFFDFPRKKGQMTVEMLVDSVQKGARAIQKHLHGINGFYLDNFDLDDSMSIDGHDNYAFIIDTFSTLPFIPVVGLDRTSRRNQTVFDAKRAKKIRSQKIAVRLQIEDFEDFALVREDLEELVELGAELFSHWVLILDNRVCIGIDVRDRSRKIVSFINAFLEEFDFDEVIITGSSIPASIGEVIETQQQGIHSRTELAIYKRILNEIEDERLTLGDYTIVSPLYSDLDIPPAALRNVTAPKVVYTYDDVYYILRGSSLAAHPRGNQQYNDLAAELVKQPFYRGFDYSFGDDYIHQKGLGIGSGVTPSSILKPTINAHVTYMWKDFSF